MCPNFFKSVTSSLTEGQYVFGGRSRIRSGLYPEIMLSLKTQVAFGTSKPVSICSAVLYNPCFPFSTIW